MSSRFRNSAVAFAVLAMLAGCNRGERDSRGKPLAETLPATVVPDTILPGNGQPAPPDPRGAQYADNATAIAQGQMLYGQMNCAGCHSHGGGGMGPALMDAEWRYGGSMEQIVASIAEGRPGGMPAWRGKLTAQQMWQLAAYVRTLSGQESKDAVSARADEMSNTPPQTQVRREPIGSGESGQQ